MGPVESKGPPAFREMAVVADVHAHFAYGSVKDGVAAIAGTKIELLPETLDVGDVLFAVFTQIASIGIDHGGGVIKETRSGVFIHGQNHDHL